MHRFGYGQFRRGIPPDIMDLVVRIYRIRALDEIRHSEYRKEYGTIKAVAEMASVKFSNQIEGIVASDDRIRALIERHEEPTGHNEMGIAGYRDALDLVHTESEELDFDEDTVLELHRIMLSYTGKHGGSYKNRDNAIVSVRADGTREVVYRPVSARDTPGAMDRLFLTYQKERDDLEPLILIPCVILDYLCIHPFLDGNGRTSRLLTELLLHKHGFDICRYVSLDEHIACTRGEYYDSLAESSKGWDGGTPNYFPFVRYFLRRLLECYIDLDTRFALVNGRKMKKGERIERMLESSVAPVSKRQIMTALPDISKPTVDAVIEGMLEDGRIRKIGTYRDARYRMVR